MNMGVLKSLASKDFNKGSARTTPCLLSTKITNFPNWLNAATNRTTDKIKIYLLFGYEKNFFQLPDRILNIAPN